MKQRSKAAAPAPVTPKRVRKEGLPKSRRTFIAMAAPDLPRAAVDASPPLMGQRKRKPARRPKLSPNPVSV